MDITNSIMNFRTRLRIGLSVDREIPRIVRQAGRGFEGGEGEERGEVGIISTALRLEG